MTELHWTAGNQLRLLENGEEYFPRVLELIAGAQQEVLVETFILFEDTVGRDLHEALVGAARRGIRVLLVVDGFGSADLSAGFIESLRAAGASFHFYDLRPRVLTLRTNLFRRLHRKTVLVDGRYAIIGGINFSEEHLRSFGAQSKQDYAVEVQGPLVAQARSYFIAQNGAPPRRRWFRRPPRRTLDIGGPGAALVVRDNQEHRDDIEHVYRLGIRLAQEEIIIANAYFLPGYRLMRDLRNAALRGVSVHLILQGKSDKPIVAWATSALEDYLLRAGVRIHRFIERPLHAKVAVIDASWATVGSSNLDPLSLYLNLESNVVIRDLAFTGELRARLRGLMQRSCAAEGLRRRYLPGLLRHFLSVLVFHVLRRLPALVGWLPGHSAMGGRVRSS